MVEEYKDTEMVSRAGGRITKLNIRTRSVRPSGFLFEFGGINRTIIFTSATCCAKETCLGAVANVSEDGIIISYYSLQKEPVTKMMRIYLLPS